MLEKYGTPRCTMCETTNVIDHGDDEVSSWVDGKPVTIMEKTADGESIEIPVMIKTGKVHYECSACGMNFYLPKF